MDPTRAFAFSLLRAVFEQHRPLEEALDRLPAGEARDRAAGHRLAAAVLRRTGTLDAVLEPHMKKAPPEAVRLILRLGAAGLLLLGTPAHAAVGTSVDLARAAGFAKFAGLVNAVLRRVAESGASMLAELDSPRLDTPPWMWAAWGAGARAIATAHQGEAPLDVSRAPGVDVPEGGVLLPTGSVRFPAGTRVADIAGFEGGKIWVQDAAAAMPARLLDARPGERVADLCAAPGGKTAQLAFTGAAVVAVERDERRLVRLRQNLARLGAEVGLVHADAAVWQPPAPLDAILLDAPCSATGTIRRHPDVLHLKRERDIAANVQAQHRLIAAAAGMLRPRGRLIYAVCSLQPEEGAGAAGAAEAAGLRPFPFSADELGALAQARTPEGWLLTHPALWPEAGGMDGFFVARFVK